MVNSQVYQVQAMPMPKVTGLPHFDGSHLEEFVVQYELMARTYGISDVGKTIGFIWYCTKDPIDVFSHVKDLDSYIAAHWGALLSDLREAFPDESERGKYSTRQLRSLSQEQAKKPLESVAELSQYRLSFLKIARWLQERNLITESELTKEFLRGLPKDIQRSLAVRETMRSEARARAAVNGEEEEEEGPREPTYQELYEEVKTLLDEGDNFYASTMREIAREEQEVVPSLVQTLVEPVRNVRFPSNPIQQPLASLRNGRNSEEMEVERLTREMSELKLMMATLQNGQPREQQSNNSYSSNNQYSQSVNNQYSQSNQYPQSNQYRRPPTPVNSQSNSEPTRHLANASLAR
jgi:hypothetical protein